MTNITKTGTIGFKSIVLNLSWLMFGLTVMAVSAQGGEVKVRTTIDLPIDRAWERLRDYSLAHNYVEGVVRTEITTERTSGEGASRKVYFDETRYNNETIVEWREGQGFTMRLHEDDRPIFPFSHASFQYQLSAIDKASSHITMTMTYEIPWGSLGQLMDSWIIRSEMESAVVKAAAGFKYYYETGLPATDEDRDRLKGFVDLLH